MASSFSRMRDPRERARQRANDAFAYAVELRRDTAWRGNVHEEPRRWLEVAEAFEVAADAMEEAGWEDRAEHYHSLARAIYEATSRAYEPTLPREVWKRTRTRR